MSEVVTHTADGKLAKGHPWRFKPGKSGHLVRYMPKALERECGNYITQQAELEKRLTWSGLAVYLGMSRQGLDRYYHGEVGKTQNVRDSIVVVLDYYRSYMESQLECAVDAKFRLTNQFSDTWKETKHVHVDTTETQHLIVQLPAELYAKLNKAAGGTLKTEAIDSTCVEVDDE